MVQGNITDKRLKETGAQTCDITYDTSSQPTLEPTKP